MGIFYIDTQSGSFATHDQLREHELLDRDGRSQPPWHRLQSTGDATTLWYSLMRKHTRGIWLGTLVMRTSDHRDKLLREGWEEVPPESTGASLHGKDAELAPAPFDVEGWEHLNGRMAEVERKAREPGG